MSIVQNEADMHVRAAAARNRRAELLAVAEECERAEQGSRELSDRVLLAWGWTKRQYENVPDVFVWIEPDSTIEHFYDHPRPSPTESLDACAAGMPEGWKLANLGDLNTGGAWCKLRKGHITSFEKSEVVLRCETQPLVWTAAICCALAAEIKEQEKQP